MKSAPWGAPRPATPTAMFLSSGISAFGERRNSSRLGSGFASRTRFPASQRSAGRPTPPADQPRIRRKLDPIFLGFATISAPRDLLAFGLVVSLQQFGIPLLEGVRQLTEARPVHFFFPADGAQQLLVQG